MNLPVSTSEGAKVPTVSVVIPTYNRSALLLRAIGSVMQQTYTDYELIVIDDGSTDDTRERLQPYMENIRYFYQQNQGASAAQNAGVRVAKGKWVSILASDDVWLPTKLERQIEVLAALGSEFGACVTNCHYIGNSAINSTVFEEAGFRPDLAFGPLDNPLQYTLEENGMCVQSLLVLRSLFNEIGGFDESLGLSEDRDLIFRLSYHTRFCFVSASLVGIDRTPDVQRLTNLLSRKDDQSYAWLVSAYKKMLVRPELLSRETREFINDKLIAIYYGWTKERIAGLRLLIAFKNIIEIRRLGQSYRRTLCSLLFSGAKKLTRIVWRPARALTAAAGDR